MVKKTIEYEDYNGNKIKDDFFFDISPAEAIEMETEQHGGLGENLKKMANTNNIPELMKFFKEFVLRSYGVKSPDGIRFIKSPQLAQEFTETKAYSELFVELLTDHNALAAFVNGVLPKNLKEIVAKVEADQQAQLDEQEKAKLKQQEALNNIHNIPAPRQ